MTRTPVIRAAAVQLQAECGDVEFRQPVPNRHEVSVDTLRINGAMVDKMNGLSMEIPATCHRETNARPGAELS